MGKVDISCYIKNILAFPLKVKQLKIYMSLILVNSYTVKNQKYWGGWRCLDMALQQLQDGDDRHRSRNRGVGMLLSERQGRTIVCRGFAKLD